MGWQVGAQPQLIQASLVQHLSVPEDLSLAEAAIQWLLDIEQVLCVLDFSWHKNTGKNYFVLICLFCCCCFLWLARKISQLSVMFCCTNNFLDCFSLITYPGIIGRRRRLPGNSNMVRWQPQVAPGKVQGGCKEKFLLQKSGEVLQQALAQGGDGVTIPGGVQELWHYGTQSVGMAGVGWARAWGSHWSFPNVRIVWFYGLRHSCIFFFRIESEMPGAE